METSIIYFDIELEGLAMIAGDGWTGGFVTVLASIEVFSDASFEVGEIKILAHRNGDYKGEYWVDSKDYPAALFQILKSAVERDSSSEIANKIASEYSERFRRRRDYFPRHPDSISIPFGTLLR